MDDIFSGILALKTAANTATRSLSRQTLFQILQHCETIDVASVNAATGGRYAYSTVASYAAVARVASKAIGSFIHRLPEVEPPRLPLGHERRNLDAPYRRELSALQGRNTVRVISNLIEGDTVVPP